jgi:hypothetical protein
MSSLGDALHLFLKDTGLATQLKDWPILDAWSKAAGVELARRARAVRFQNGELLVEVESATHLQELKSFTGERYRRLANDRLGGDSIQRVVFKLKR